MAWRRESVEWSCSVKNVFSINSYCYYPTRSHGNYTLYQLFINYFSNNFKDKIRSIKICPCTNPEKQSVSRCHHNGRGASEADEKLGKVFSEIDRNSVSKSDQLNDSFVGSYDRGWTGPLRKFSGRSWLSCSCPSLYAQWCTDRARKSEGPIRTLSKSKKTENHHKFC